MCKLMTLVELFGYKDDRKVGLELLMKAGGRTEGAGELIGTGESCWKEAVRNANDNLILASKTLK